MKILAGLAGKLIARLTPFSTSIEKVKTFHSSKNDEGYRRLLQKQCYLLSGASLITIAYSIKKFNVSVCSRSFFKKSYPLSYTRKQGLFPRGAHKMQRQGR